MAFDPDATIAAIASAPSGAARGIIRVSGPQAIACLDAVFRAAEGMRLATVEKPAALSGAIHAPSLGNISCELLIWPTHRSYTRELAGEIHTFGSPPVLEAALAAVCRAGARLAQPGEFTLRAFLAGRMDLTQAEAVLGVIDAVDRRQLNVALDQLAGGMGKPLHQLRERLLELLAHLEAGLDFVEEDIEFISKRELLSQLQEGLEQVKRAERQMASRGESRSERRVTLMGLPNVGKSSLFNALAGEPAAIVSPTPGATRDFVARRVVWEGLAILLVDTAGEEAAGETPTISAAAQAARQDQAAQADVRILCLDRSRPLLDEERAWLREARGDSLLVVATKADLSPAWRNDCDALEVSSQSGAGIAELRRRVVAALQSRDADASAVVAPTAARCHQSLHRAAAALREAIVTAEVELGEELVAVSVRAALDELGQVVGAVYTDDILDRIFSRFCIGK